MAKDSKEKIKQFVAKDSAQFAERVKFAYDETLDIALDQFDTFKKLDVKVQAAIGGGAALLLLIIAVVVMVAMQPGEIPVHAGFDQTGILGENFIVIENESEEELTGLTLVVDNAYIYRIEKLTPFQQQRIVISDFHQLQGELGVGSTVEEDFTPVTMVVHQGEQTKAIALTEKEKTFFEKLFGG